MPLRWLVADHLYLEMRQRELASCLLQSQISIPTGPSCWGRVHLPSACLPGLHAGICHFFPGWRFGHAPGTPGWNLQGFHRLSTPSRRCSRTKTARSHLQNTTNQGRTHQQTNIKGLCVWQIEVNIWCVWLSLFACMQVCAPGLCNLTSSHQSFLKLFLSSFQKVIVWLSPQWVSCV